jgi:hypothetical protein
MSSSTNGGWLNAKSPAIQMKGGWFFRATWEHYFALASLKIHFTIDL